MRDEKEVLRKRREMEIAQLRKNLEQQIAEKQRLKEDHAFFKPRQNRKPAEEIDMKRVNTCMDQSDRLNISNTNLGKTSEQQINLIELKQIAEQPIEAEYSLMQIQIEVHAFLTIDSE